MSAPKDFNDRMLSLGLARVSEAAAHASARLIGRGDEKAADQAAVNAIAGLFGASDGDSSVVETLENSYTQASPVLTDDGQYLFYLDDLGDAADATAV